ncbi:MAG: CDP-alcohol phosphatidyltransferase family protein [Vicinamibacterales bacterium]|nr:CDP-alcohol phosphatidyltransferase family protein [Vicinamibacterales bacterium]MDP7670678.1 CDP-alcohol phosphatidyltransferase family protein [Vicinamibacterales bacterium]HJO39039.1 CDP-alcohol phosphatidyltransferase family protein [Vicinamibacterales bacterium]
MAEGARAPGPSRGVVRRHAANLVSILGILPIGLLVLDGGRDYVIPLMLYNNIMDDLDGVLAIKLGTKSEFGARLDNVCDAIAHTAFVMVVGMRGGSLCAAASLVAVTAIILRVVSRLSPGAVTAHGSPTNELIRHMLFILLLTALAGVPAAPFLTVAFVLHAVSMHVRYRMPFLIRSMTTSATAIGLLNVALVVAWVVPYTAPLIAASFILTYLYSFARGAVKPTSSGAPVC